MPNMYLLFISYFFKISYDCLYLSMTIPLNKSIYFLFISLFSFTSLSFSKVETDSIKIDRFERHIKSLDYISRKTSDKKQYLNLAKSYCDSILLLDSDNAFAKKFKDKIELTLIANGFNMNHRVQLFELFNGFPEYMAFADDPIEYAYDDAIASLLQSKEIDYQKGPIGDARFPSIIVRENCDDEMFEIANQIIIQNSSHYIIPLHQLESILGVDNASNLINGEVDEKYLELILKDLNAETIGVFTLNDLDVIENSIWYVQSSFYAFKLNSGFTQTIFTRGFNHDKRNTNIALIFLSLLGSLVLISLISFLDQYKKIMRTIADEILVTEKIKKFLELFVNKIGRVFTYFIIPLIFSFLMIYAVSNIIPEPESDIREATSRIWLLTLTLGMSLFPTLVNLIIVNRLDLDGFHIDKGYRLFFNTSLYTTYFPIFVFYIIKFETFPVLEHFLLIIVTFAIAWLLARSYYQFTSITIHKNLKIQAGIGLIFGIISLVALNFFILSDLSYISLTYGFIIALVFSTLHSLIDKKIKQKNSEKEKQSSDQSLIKSDIYLNEVFDPVKNIYEKIKLGMKNDDLDIMILPAPMGVGKTASLLKAGDLFKENDEWDVYYGDCDEIQDESAKSFEPFLEAFGKKLNISQFSNRGEQIDKLKDSAIAAGSAVGVNTDILTDYERDNQKSMTETCIEIIDRLEEEGKKSVFILEDLHFIDPETYSFLKHFITIINNNPFLRKSICIVLSLRNGENELYRGINEKTLRKDLAEINKAEDSPVIPETLYEYKDVNLRDFVKHLSNQDNSFKIQSYTLNQINDLFNNKLKQNTDLFVLTPLYIKKTIEGWIEDGILKFSPDGYLLTRTLSDNDLPNSDEVDKYYHSIFESYDEKWQRLLESAAIIGNRFDAEILAKVWGYELLDILSFLEKAVNDDLLEDLSHEDNMYKFEDKRIVSAIKSYFKTYKNKKEQFIIKDKNGLQIEESESKIKEFEKKFNLSRGKSQFKKLLSNEGYNLIRKPESDKQIVIEYNKRYVAFQQNIIDNPSFYSVEDLLRVTRRLSTLIAGSQYRSQFYNLIREISIRFIISGEFNKLDAFSKFLFGKGILNISTILNVLSVVANKDSDKEVSTKKIKEILCGDIHGELSKVIYNSKNELINISNNDFERELIFITCLYYNENLDESILKKGDFEFLIGLENEWSEMVLFNLRLLINHSIFTPIHLNYSKLFRSYDDLLKSLKKSKDYKFYSHKIATLKLSHKAYYFSQESVEYLWSEQYSKPQIENVKKEFDSLYNKLIRYNDLKLIFEFLIEYIRFVSNRLSKKLDAIELFLKTIPLFENNSKYKREEIVLKMQMIRLHCGDVFVSKYRDIAKDNYETVNSYFERRFNKKTKNEFVDTILDYKIEYMKAAQNYKQLKKLAKYVLDRESLNYGENSFNYATACFDYAHALRFNGDGKGFIKWYEKNISIRKKLYSKEELSNLKVTYHNFVYKLIELAPKEKDKILKYSKDAIGYANPDEIKYWKFLRGHAIAQSHVGNNLEGINFFKKSLECLENKDFENKEYHISNLNLHLAITNSKVNLKKSIPMIKKALKEADNPAVLSMDQINKSGVFQNRELIEIANKILKDNK